jgi:hypothetical protein
VKFEKNDDKDDSAKVESTPSILPTKKETPKPSKKVETDPALMQTILRIPFERAPEAPSWMSKKKAGKKLDPMEAEAYFTDRYE